MSCLALSLQPANGSDILLQTRVDVTPEKLSRKYAEIYMALDIVLRGVSSIRLAAMLGSMHGDGLAKMVHFARQWSRQDGPRRDLHGSRLCLFLFPVKFMDYESLCGN